MILLSLAAIFSLFFIALVLAVYGATVFSIIQQEKLNRQALALRSHLTQQKAR